MSVAAAAWSDGHHIGDLAHVPGGRAETRIGVREVQARFGARIDGADRDEIGRGRQPAARFAGTRRAGSRGMPSPDSV